MKDGSLIAEAALVLGASAITGTNDRMVVTWPGKTNTRFDKSGEHYSASGDLVRLKEIQQKYAELGVKRWAKTKGYSVRQKGRELVLTKW